MNTQFYVKGTSNPTPVVLMEWQPENGKSLKMFNTLLTGGNNGSFADLTGVKLVNTVDENLNQISNQ
jgi:hypothetical protein